MHLRRATRTATSTASSTASSTATSTASRTSRRTSSRTSRRAVAAVAVFAAAALTLGAAPAPAAPPPAPPGQVLSPAAARAAAEAREHQRVIDFWTVQRVRRAKPRDVLPVRRSKAGSTPVSPYLAAPPGSGVVTGSSWTKGGRVLKTTGKVLFQLGSNFYVCTAGAVSDAQSDRTIVLSAGHCAFNNEGGARQWATNWLFVPDYDSAPATLTADRSFCAQTVYGCWTATALVLLSGFTTNNWGTLTALTNDWAFAVVKAGGKQSRQLDAVVGSQPIAYTRASAGATTYSFGYPQAAPYTGKDLVYCKGPVSSDISTAGQTYMLGCLMTPGCSGGPWLTGFNETTGIGTLRSVNSYSSDGDPHLYGPIFNSRTQATFTAATTAAGNTVVSGG